MLTIISVSYKSKALLDMNYRLVKALNPHASFRWIVVQNTPASDLENDLAMDDPRFEMIRGAVTPESEKESIGFKEPSQHAKALNLAISYTDADLILALDPDCYFLMPNWIELIYRAYQKGINLLFLERPILHNIILNSKGFLVHRYVYK